MELHALSHLLLTSTNSTTHYNNFMYLVAYMLTEIVACEHGVSMNMSTLVCFLFSDSVIRVRRRLPAKYRKMAFFCDFCKSYFSNISSIFITFFLHKETLG